MGQSSFWRRQLTDHGFRTIFLTGIVYTCIFGALWLTATTRPQVITTKDRVRKQPGSNRTSSEDVDPENVLLQEPERWTQRPLPHYNLTLRNLTVVTPEQYYDVETDKIASNRWIRQELEEGVHNKFDWTQFLDLSATKKYDSGDLDEKDYPYILLTDLENMELPRFKATTVPEACMMGRLYVKHRMSAPYQILALPDPEIAAQKDVPPAGQRYPVKHKDSKRNHRQFSSKEHHELERVGPLLLELDGTPYNSRGLVNIPEDMFIYDPYAELNKLLESDNPLSHLHAISMTDALAKVAKSGKYFYEILIDKEPHRMGDHYDWRFFRGFLSDEEQSYVKERLVRAWSQFADAEGISYWLAHGSMIGWYWNGMTMPWDTDNDIQVPVKELDRLAREFNGTLVLQHPNDDDGKFLIDVSPWIVERDSGNKWNLIDARFIDVENGAYIDITGLAKYRRGDRPIGCKNHHFYAYDTLSPMRRTLYEGSPVYVNHNFVGLREEYKRFDSQRFGSWQFNDRLGLWVNTKSCRQVAETDNIQSIKTCITANPIPDCDPETSELGTCDERLVSMHEKLRDRWAFHQVQDIHSSDPDTGELTEELIGLLDRFYPALGYV